MIPLGFFQKGLAYQNIALNKGVTLTKGSALTSVNNLTKGYRKVSEGDQAQNSKVSFFEADAEGKVEFEIDFGVGAYKSVDKVMIFSGYGGTTLMQLGDDLGNYNAPTEYNFTTAYFEITGFADWVLYNPTISSNYMAEEYVVIGIVNNALKFKFQTVIAPYSYLCIVGVEVWGNN